MFRTALAAIALPALAIALPAAALAQQAETGKPPQRIRDVTLAPGQACPPETANEVVVCHRLDNPYRIPKALRDEGPIPAANQSWVARTQTVDQVGRVAGGLPDTCSPVGTGGQSGCAMLTNQQWAADQRARRAAANAGTAASGNGGQ